MNLQRTFFYFVCMALSAPFAHAEHFTSGPDQAALIELYTSEGCSSCPPAESRMNSFSDHHGLWKEFVPVAFHVDYWNYLGWPDRFSMPEFTARQRNYSRAWKADTIYTPCFVRNGKTDRHPKLSDGPAKPGILKAVITDGKIDVHFSPEDETSENLIVWAAPLTGKVTTDVKRGENRGRILEHCFVALNLQKTPMKASGGTFTASLPLDRTGKPKAISIWISRADSLEPIQATGGWLE